jgi:hypothetical protein
MRRLRECCTATALQNTGGGTRRRAAAPQPPVGQRARRARQRAARYLLERRAMNENFSLIVMCLFLLGSLAFLAQQLTSYH